MKIVRSLFLHVLTGASAATAVLLVAVAYSDRLHPASNATLACAGMLFPIILIVNVIVLLAWVLFRWRRAWIQVTGLILAIPAIRIYLPLHFSSDAPPGCIKVISYNVACYSVTDNYDNPYDSIYAYLKRQNADIVCVQEDVSLSRKVLASYDELYPYNDTLHVNRPASHYINALGIHSRYPILRKERLPLESEANGAAAFFLLIDRDTVVVVNNHLESTHLSLKDRKDYTDIISGDADRNAAKAGTLKLLDKVSVAMVRRARQAEMVHEYVERYRRRYPVIVCGDFNDTPISYARRTIADGLTDCYVETGNGLGISYNRKGFYFRIDQMMCSKHFTPYHCYVDNHIEASDHYPVVCWLKREPQR